MGHPVIPAQASFVSLGAHAGYGQAMTIGTVSWSVPRRGHGLLGADRFLATLEQLGDRGCEADLLLAGLERALGNRWVALNPAHVPYWPQIRSKGFVKVGKIGASGETMARVVARKEAFADGSIPPAALVHCNSFYADEPKTRAYASVAFDATGRMTPCRTEEGIVAGPGIEETHWLFSTFEIPA